MNFANENQFAFINLDPESKNQNQPNQNPVQDLPSLPRVHKPSVHPGSLITFSARLLRETRFELLLIS